jgi:hypothetical protein
MMMAMFTAGASAATNTNNDDSCDIGTAPAATLLLPYFEVETGSRGIDTIFTIVNVGRAPAIAHLTLWTDWSFPVLTFSTPLGGYETRSISLFDLIVGGAMPPSSCDLPAVLPVSTVLAVRQALIDGTYPACGGKGVGGAASTHRTPTTAAGYITIDVTSVCSSTLPTDPAYFLNEILFDNVLTGDYQTIDRTAGHNFSGGSPLVHIRAIPEGGPAGAPLIGSQTNLPYTFYGRFITTAPANADRRQPLPSTFAARWVEGGAGNSNTDFKIWREAASGSSSCATAQSNRARRVVEVVRFDEHENPMGLFSTCLFEAGCDRVVYLPATSRTTTASEDDYPILNSPAGDTAGWMYLNIDMFDWQAPPPAHALQGWVTVSMSAGGSEAGLFGVEYDATWLGNGCSAAAGSTTASGGLKPIGPAGGILVCPPNDAKCTPGTRPYTGSNATP